MFDIISNFSLGRLKTNVCYTVPYCLVRVVHTGLAVDQYVDRLLLGGIRLLASYWVVTVEISIITDLYWAVTVETDRYRI